MILSAEMILKRNLLLIGMALIYSASVFSQCFDESFVNMGPYGGYQTEIWIGDDGYTLTATDARTDQNINGDAICIRDGSLTVASVPGGIGSLTVTTQRAFSGGAGNMDLKVNGTIVGTIPYDGTVQTTTINNINIIGTVSIEIDATNSSSDRPKIDDLSWTCFSSSNTITTSTVSPLTYTIDCTSGQSGSVDFTSTGTFNAGNVFTAELSDASGSFAAPTPIGSLTSSGTDPTGTINFTIPAGTFSGSGYRIRIVSDDPAINGSDNGTDITINLTGGPCASSCPYISSILFNSCGAGSNEGLDEYWTFETGSSSLNIDDLVVTYPNGGTYCNSGCGTNTLGNNPTYLNDLNNMAGCSPDLFVYATTIPPNSTVLVFTGQDPTSVLDFSANCSAAPVYVVFSNNSSGTGRFSNSSVRDLTVDFNSTCDQTVTYDGSMASSNGGTANYDSNGNLTNYTTSSSCIYPLPVDLKTFKGEYSETMQSVHLYWESSSEMFNSHYEIYHSTSGYDFSHLKNVEGSGTSEFSIHYNTEHGRPAPGMNYYQLYSVDYDGTKHDQGIIAINVEQQAVFYDDVSNSIIFPESGHYMLYNSAGQLMTEVKNTNSISAPNSGVYFVINDKTGESTKIIVR